MAKKETNTKNKKSTTISVDELLARRGALEDFSKFYSEMFDTTFEIEKVKPSDITTIMEGEGDEYEKYGRLIYISCPYFRQKELQNKLDVENPYDVVEALYGDNYAEFYMFGNFILKRYGFTGDRLQRVKKVILSDDEAYFYHYYIQKGHNLKSLYELNENERLFYAASILVEKEEQAKQWGKTIGVVLALKDKCSPQLKKVADSMGITEKEAKKLHKQAKDLSKELGNGFKKASAVCAAAIGAVAVATQQLVSQTMQAGDRVDKMSQKIGLSRQKFQQWDYILSQSGADIEKMQVGMKTLSQQMVNSTKNGSEAQKIFKKLGVSVKDSRGHFIKQEEAFERVIMAFQKMPDGIEKANMAQKLFGKTGSDLRPLLNGVRGNVEELKKKYVELGLGMSDEAIDASVKLTDTMDTIKRSMGGLTLSIGASFLPIIQEFSDKFIENMPQIRQAVTPVIEGLIGALKFLSEHMELVIGVCTTLASTFVAFNVINGVIKTIATLQKVIQFVTAAQGIWNAVMIANPIGAIAVGVGLLIGAVVMLVRNWDTVKAAFVSFYEKIQPALSTIGKYIKIAFAFTPIGMFINGIKLLVQNWDKVTETVRKAIDTVKQFIGLKPGKKTVEVEAKTTKDGGSEKPKKHALGTSYSTGGPAIVGEYGPELLNLNKGDTVTPAPKTQQILKSNTQKIEINVHIAGNLIGNGEFLEQLKNALALELSTALATV